MTSLDSHQLNLLHLAELGQLYFEDIEEPYNRMMAERDAGVRNAYVAGVPVSQIAEATLLGRRVVERIVRDV